MDKLSIYIDRFLQNIKYARGFSPHSIRAYTVDLKAFQKYLNESDFQSAVFKYLSENQAKKLKTFARKISTLRSFLRFLEENNVDFKKSVYEYLRYPRNEKKIPEFLGENEILAIIDSIDAKNFYGLRDKVLFLLIFSSGLRVSEATNLKFSDINIEKRYCRVVGKGAKERITFFTKKTQKFLSYYLKKREHYLRQKKVSSEYVFINKYGNKISERSIHRRLTLWIHNAGITKKIHPHILRHSFATHLLSKGVDIMFLKELLGHKNIDTTQIYTHINFSDLKRHIDKISEDL